MSRSADPNSPTFNLHRMIGDWSEGPSDSPSQEGEGAPAEPGDVTWLHRSFNNAQWTEPGGNYVSQVSASAPVGTTRRGGRGW